jgi:hypothetical protein
MESTFSMAGRASDEKLFRSSHILQYQYFQEDMIVEWNSLSEKFFDIIISEGGCERKVFDSDPSLWAS